MYSLNFNGIDTWLDYGLILTDVDIEVAEPKRVLVNVPGADGMLDLTPEPIRYGNRLLTFELKKGTWHRKFKSWEWLIDKIYRELSGPCDNIKINEIGGEIESEWHWRGFVTLSNIEIAKHLGAFTIRVDAYPYQISDARVQREALTTTQKTITFTNKGSKALETITAECTESCTLVFGGSTITIASNTPTTIRFALPPGESEITASTTSGSGILKLTWTEERL